MSQTFQDLEIIVMDDGSTEQGEAIVLAIKRPITYLMIGVIPRDASVPTGQQG